MNTVQTSSNKELVIFVKALRTSFNKIKHDIISDSVMSDEYIIKQVRQAQAERKLFESLVNTLKDNGYDLYREELLLCQT